MSRSAPSGPSSTSIVAILFLDLVDSTALMSKLGDAEYAVLRRRCDSVWRRTIERFRGREVKHLGDGMMVIFGSASDAVDAASELHRVTGHVGSAVGALMVRVGASLGEATQEGDDWFGTPVVEAARLCSVAPPGRTFVSETVHLLAESHTDATFTPVGPLKLKGLPGPVLAYDVESVLSESLTLPSAVDELTTRSFVGRSAEIKRLQGAWERALHGTPSVALLAGEAGIGKTSLAAEAARRAAETGATVLYGRCNEDVRVPYQPFAEALGQLAGLLSKSALAALIGPDASELARILPDVAGGPVRRGNEEVDPDLARYRSFQAVQLLLSRVTEQFALCIVLDDLHWATKPTVLLLRHLVRADDPARMLIVGTYRDTDLDRNDPLAEALPDLRREPSVERIAVRGLEPGDVVALLGRSAGHDLDDRAAELARALHDETEGNPLFIGELIRHLQETGVVFERGGRWTSDVASVDDVVLPEGVREAITRRVGRLSAAADHVLRVAAVAGPEFSFRTLQAACVDMRGDVLDVIDEALAAGILHDLGGTRFAFAHGVIRQTLYSELSSARRVRLHRLVGEAMEQQHEPVEALAHHFAEAAWDGQADKAAMYALDAARSALERFAFEEAVSHLERGRAALDAEQDPDPLRRAELLIEFSESFARSLAVVPARRTALEAAEQARRANAGELVAKAAVIAADFEVVRVGSPDLATARLVEQALATISDDDPATRACLLAALANYLSAAEGRGEEARPLVEEAVDLARKEQDVDALLQALVVHANVLAAFVQPEQTLEIAQEIAAIALEHADRRRQAQALQYLVRARLELGDLAGALEATADLERHSGLGGLPTLLSRGVLTLVTGEFTRAEQIFTQILSFSNVDENAASAAAGGLLQSFRERGEFAEFRPLVASAVEDNPTLLAFQCALAILDAELGDHDVARRRVRELLDRGLPRDITWMASHTLLAETASLVDDVPSASELYPILAPHAGRAAVVANYSCVTGAVDRYLGMLAATQGDRVRAAAHYEAALALERAMPSPPLVARTEYWYGSLLRPTDPERARQLLESAHTTAFSLGMAKLASDAADAVASIPE